MNNRQIKFRLYSKDENRFLFQDEFYIQEGNIIYSKGSQYIMGRENNVLQQFTGLIDKNGREIYEGDIIKFNDFPTNVETHISEIIYKNGAFRSKYSGAILEGYELEVLGNLFENPKLIK